MATPKEEKERIAKLEQENKELKEQLAAAQKKAEELEKAKPASKSRMQASAVLQMLAEGPLTMDRLAKLNPKYPSDPIYYARTLLHADIKLVRRSGQPSLYMTPDQFTAYSAELEQQKKQQEATKQEIKEEIPQAKAAQAVAVHAA
jgi:hypothetical protein